MLVKDFKVVKLGLALNDLNSSIKRQGVCIWHHLGSLQKKSRMLQMHKKNYESHPKFCKQKFVPMHPILKTCP
jgi:hypothetical protein